jgi:N-acetylglucosamine kinase-like BadF-type ATPase
MLSFLKPDPKKRLQKEYEKLTTQAFQAQRNGDIRGYSLLTEEAEKVKAKLEAVKV